MSVFDNNWAMPTMTPAPAVGGTGEAVDPMEQQFDPNFVANVAPAPAPYNAAINDPWALGGPAPAPAPTTDIWGQPAPAPAMGAVAGWGAAPVGAPVAAAVDPRFVEGLKKQHAETKLQIEALSKLVRMQRTQRVENHLPRRRTEDEALTFEEQVKVIEQNYISKTAAASDGGVGGDGTHARGAVGASSLRLAAATVYGGDRRKSTGVWKGSPAQRAKAERERLLRQSPQTKACTPTKAAPASLPTEIQADHDMVDAMVADGCSAETGVDFDHRDLSVIIEYVPVPHDANRVRNAAVTVFAGGSDFVVRLRLTAGVGASPSSSPAAGGGGGDAGGGYIASTGPALLELLKSVRVTLVKKDQPNPVFNGDRARAAKRLGRYFFQNVDPRKESAPLRSKCGLDVEFRIERHCTWDKDDGCWKDKDKQRRYVDALVKDGWAVIGDRARKTVPPGKW